MHLIKCESKMIYILSQERLTWVIQGEITHQKLKKKYNDFFSLIFLIKNKSYLKPYYFDFKSFFVTLKFKYM